MKETLNMRQQISIIFEILLFM